jgi:hypothetical protein
VSCVRSWCLLVTCRTATSFSPHGGEHWYVCAVVLPLFGMRGGLHHRPPRRGRPGDHDRADSHSALTSLALCCAAPGWPSGTTTSRLCCHSTGRRARRSRSLRLAESSGTPLRATATCGFCGRRTPGGHARSNRSRAPPGEGVRTSRCASRALPASATRLSCGTLTRPGSRALSTARCKLGPDR